MADGNRFEDLLGDLPHVEAAQVRRCARALLRQPLLRAGGPDAELLPLVCRHRETLRRLFGTCLGYPLRVERRFACVYKVVEGGGGRGLPGFTPRSYAYLALTLAALVESGSQTLLSRLVVDIRSAAADAGVVVGDDLVELRALAAALRHLVTLGVIEETEGTVAAVAHRGSAEALITVDTELLGLITANVRQPAEQLPVASGQGVGVVALRRLAEDPVVLYADLPVEEADYLRGHHRQVGYWLDRYFGLQLEVRAEGMLAIDPDDVLTDLAFPASSTVARMALLALEPLLATSSPLEIGGCHAIDVERIRSVCVDLAERHRSSWAKSDLSNLDVLTSRVTSLLLQMRIAQRLSDDVVLLVPAAHRWQPLVEERGTVGEPADTEDDADEPTLFDDEEVSL